MTNRLNGAGEDGLRAREARKVTYNESLAKLSKEEVEKFEALMQDLFKKRGIDPISYSALAEELRWEKLPLFLDNKGITTFHIPNFPMRIFLNIRDRIASALKPKSAAGFKVPDGEIIDDHK